MKEAGREKAVHADVVRIVNLRSLVFWGVAAYLALQVMDAIAATLLLFAIAIFFAMVLDPPIRRLDRHGLSRGLSTGIIALSALAGIALVVALTARPLAAEIADLSKNGTRYVAMAQERVEDWLEPYPGLKERIQTTDLSARVSAAAQNALPRIGRYSLTLLSGILSALLVFIITLYTVADPKPLVRGVVLSVPPAHRRTLLRILLGTTKQLQNWVRATFWMMLTIGVLSGLALWVIGVPNALLFAVIAGIGEAIPTIGPILSAIPPFIVMLATDPTKAVYVLIAFFFIQQLENNLLVPRIMASTMKLHPVSVMFFVVAMGALLGPIGILLATPLCAVAKVVYEETYRPQTTASRRRLTGSENP